MRTVQQSPDAAASPASERAYVLRLSFPAIMENLMGTLMQITNMIMVGGLGAFATATVAVNSAPTWVINSLMTVVGVGSTALIAKATGARNQKQAEAICRQTFLLGLLLGIFITILTYLIAPMIPLWMHAEPALHKDAVTYMRILCAGFIPYYTGISMAAALRGAGDMKTPMKISTAASILNVVLGFFLIYPTRQITLSSVSFPILGAGMGVAGAATATAITTTLSGIWTLAAVLSRKSRLRFSPSKLRPDPSVLRPLLRIGTPAALERLSISLGQVLFIGMVSALGTVQLAAHHLVVTIESLSYMPGYGFAAAASTLVGQSLGAGDSRMARSRGGLSIRLCIITMSAIGLVLFLLAPWWLSLFTPDPQVRLTGVGILRICVLEQPATALFLVSAGALRGAGDTKAPFLIALVSMLLRLALTYLFIQHMNMGIQGAWWAMVADLWVRGILTSMRFRTGRWLGASEIINSSL